ncbi:MAG: TIGR04013 family B12-binding domain/radical SAM domain-containing protein [Elusimicrobia bacterium]|nr:TIGR04013 family B12-binding domain/radical SAM domain-containing protein [Elusimicrobiota bacterium]
MSVRAVFYYSRENRSSINALAAALERHRSAGVTALFPATPRGMAAALRKTAAEGLRAAACFSFFSCQRDSTAEIVGKLRREAPDAIFIAGGPHTSALPEDALSIGFDYAVAGEGENVLPPLLAAIGAGNRPAGRVIKGTRADLSAFPALSPGYGLFGPIEITRGCPYACTYCQTSFLFGARPRHRPLEQILAMMSLMFSRGLHDIRFITPDAFAYGSSDGRRLDLPALTEFMRRAGELADRRGGRIFVGSFPSEVRPDHVTPETLGLVKKYAANRRLIIGAQTASPRALGAVRRGHGPEEIYSAARLCKEFHITPYLDFIFGLPGETAEDEDASMEMISRLSALGAMIHTHAFMPLPGTPLAGATGARISPRIRRFLQGMESRGKAFGKWRAQLLAPRHWKVD